MEHEGVWERVRIRFDDGTVVGYLRDGSLVLGKPRDNLEFTSGVRYTFWGEWSSYRDKSSGKRVQQFRFKHYTVRDPLHTDAIAAYLSRYCRGTGMGIATIHRLIARYGQETLTILRSDPERVARENDRPNEDQARQVSEKLRILAGSERSRVELIALLEGHGFPAAAIDACVEQWNVSAAEAIRENPFNLLIFNIPGAGFRRVDGLYLSLGLDPHALVRQMFCIWNAVKTESRGDTWITARRLAAIYRSQIGEGATSPVRAIEYGVKEGWLTVHVDSEKTAWIADRETAEREVALARRVVEFIA